MYIENKIKQLEQLKKQIPNQVKVIAQKNKKELLDYIRIKQLFEKGIDGLGNKLKPYKPFTVAVKRAQGKDPNIVTLEDTGAFYRGFDLLVTDQYSLGIFSRDSKTPELVEKYGADIFTYTVDNIKELETKIFIEQLTEWMLKQDAFTKI